MGHDSASIKKSSINESSSSSNGDNDQIGNLSVSIPSFVLSGVGSSSHVEYQVNIKTIDAQWSVMRRFRQFRDLHLSLVTVYGPLITVLPFPSRRLFGNKSDYVSGERQRQLNAYLNVLLLTLVKVESSPIYKNPNRENLITLSAFFQDDVKEATELLE